MSDEIVEQQTPAPTEKVVVEGKPVASEIKDTDQASSALPYHNRETEKIQADRSKELEGKDKAPYHYEINGYVVEEIEGKNFQATSEDQANKLYRVTATDAEFEQVLNDKRAAEIFAETHSPQFAKNAAVKQAPAVQDVPKT